MAHLISSFINYFKNTENNIGKSHYFVGSSVCVNQRNGSIQSLLAETKSGLVFSYEDEDKGLYSLKRIFVKNSKDTNIALREIRFHKELSGHSAIVNFIDASTNSPDQSIHGKVEYLLLTEFCSGGTVADLIQEMVLTPSNVLKIFYSVCIAVRFMHCRLNPITHRGIVVENFRITSNGYVKLWNFESATVQTWEINEHWTLSERVELEKELESKIDLMHRAPEILDTSQDYPIGPSQDMWGLGCLLYYLCYGHHPFEKSTKLEIINGKYTLPENDQQYSIFHEIITDLLQPNPCLRPSIQQILNKITALAEDIHVNLTEPLYFRYQQSLNEEEYEKSSVSKIMTECKMESTNFTSIKIHKWKTENKGSIIQMLSSLNEVLWEETDDWTPPNFRKMMWKYPLEKVYTDACLFIHPDNHIGSPHYDLAKAIFEELTSSMIEYNKSTTRRINLRRALYFCGMMIGMLLNIFYLNVLYNAGKRLSGENSCSLIYPPRAYFWVFCLPLLSLEYLAVRFLMLNNTPSTNKEENIAVAIGVSPIFSLMIYYTMWKVIYMSFYNLEEGQSIPCVMRLIAWLVVPAITLGFFLLIFFCFEKSKK